MATEEKAITINDIRNQFCEAIMEQKFDMFDGTPFKRIFRNYYSYQNQTNNPMKITSIIELIDTYGSIQSAVEMSSNAEFINYIYYEIYIYTTFLSTKNSDPKLKSQAFKKLYDYYRILDKKFLHGRMFEGENTYYPEEEEIFNMLKEKIKDYITAE